MEMMAEKIRPEYSNPFVSLEKSDMYSFRCDGERQ